MRKIFTNLFSVLLISGLNAQTINGSGGPITNNGVPTYFTTNVTSLNAGFLDNTFGLIEVCLNITHPEMNEVTVSLQSPSGVIVELVNSTSLHGPNFSGTCLNSQSGVPISSA